MKCIISIVTTNVYSITSHPHVCCLTVHNDWSQEQTGTGFYLVCLTLQISLRTKNKADTVTIDLLLLPPKYIIKSPSMSVIQHQRNETAIKK